MRLLLSLTFLLLVAQVGFATDDKSFILMERNSAYGGQHWFYAGSGSELQQDKIKEEWDKDRYITGAAYTERGWFVVMSENSNFTAQTYKYTQSWPSDWIKEKYDQNYYITTVSCSASKWFVVMSKVKIYTGQRYKQASLTDLKEWYHEWRNKGYFITQATFSNGKWLWVLTQGTNIKNQGYKWANNSTLSSVIKEIWDGGDRVHLVEYADGDYFIPYGEFKDGSPAQSYKVSFNGLSDWISGEWDDGLALHYIGGGNPTSSYSSGNSVASTTTSTPTYNTTNGNNSARTYRQNVTQYGYQEVTEYQNGSKLVAFYGMCQACAGTRVCQICQGQGGIVTAGYGNYIVCVYCGQTGICPQCRNTGGYALRDSRLYDANGREIYVPRGSYSSSSTSTTTTSTSRSTSSGSCSRCGGTGVDPTANSGGSLSSWVAYYNTSGTQCRYCNSYTGHYHDRCSSCNVPTY